MVPLLVPSVQIALALGLPEPTQLDGTRYVSEISVLHTEWLKLVNAISYDALMMPTLSRGRRVVDLVADVFYAIDRTMQAWSTGVFAWGGLGTRGEDDNDLPAAEVARIAADRAILDSFTDKKAVTSFLERCCAAWQTFALEIGDEGVDLDRLIDHPRKGSMPYERILGQQRWHMSLHFRQVTYTFDQAGIEHSSHDALEFVSDLHLPTYPF